MSYQTLTDVGVHPLWVPLGNGCTHFPYPGLDPSRPGSPRLHCRSAKTREVPPTRFHRSMEGLPHPPATGFVWGTHPSLSGPTTGYGRPGMTAPYPIRGGDADVEDLLWAKPLIADFGLAAEDVAEEWRYRKGQNRAEGNLWLRKVHQVLMAESKIVRDIHTTDDLDSVARWLAEQCERFTTKAELDAFVQRHELPEIKGKSSKSRLARAQDWQVWRQKLRKPVAQYRDQMMRHIGRVHQHQQILLLKPRGSTSSAAAAQEPTPARQDHPGQR